MTRSTVGVTGSTAQAHRRQVGNRGKEAKQRMRGLAAITLRPGGHTDSFLGREVSRVGTFVYATLVLQWVNRKRRGRSSRGEMYVLRGHTARHDPETNEIHVGGADGNCFAHNFNTVGGHDRRIDVKQNPQRVAMGLELDGAIAAVADGDRADFRRSIPLPRYLFGFREENLPEFEDTPHLRYLAARAVADRAGVRLQSLRAPCSGTVEAIVQDDDALCIVLQGGDVLRYPRCAQSAVQVGSGFVTGQQLVHLVPPKHYSHWRQVARQLDAETQDWLLRETWSAAIERYETQTHRGPEYVPELERYAGYAFLDHRLLDEQRSDVRPDVVVEDARHLLGARITNPAEVVWRTRGIDPDDDSQAMDYFHDDAMRDAAVSEMRLMLGGLSDCVTDSNILDALGSPESELVASGACRTYVWSLRDIPSPHTMGISRQGLSVDLYSVRSGWRGDFHAVPSPSKSKQHQRRRRRRRDKPAREPARIRMPDVSPPTDEARQSAEAFLAYAMGQADEYFDKGDVSAALRAFVACYDSGPFSLDTRRRDILLLLSNATTHEADARRELNRCSSISTT